MESRWRLARALPSPLVSRSRAAPLSPGSCFDWILRVGDSETAKCVATLLEYETEYCTVALPPIAAEILRGSKCRVGEGPAAELISFVKVDTSDLCETSGDPAFGQAITTPFKMVLRAFYSQDQEVFDTPT